MSSSVPFKEMAVTLIDVISLLMGMMKGYLFNKEVKSVDVAVFCIIHISSHGTCVFPGNRWKGQREKYIISSLQKTNYTLRLIALF